MCGSMADIQSATAEIRQGKKRRYKKKPQCKNIISFHFNKHNMHNGLPYYVGGHNDCRAQLQRTGSHSEVIMRNLSKKLYREVFRGGRHRGLGLLSLMLSLSMS